MHKPTPAQICDIAEKTQDECHAFINMIIGMNPKLTYQDAFNTWLFRELGEIKLQIQQNKQP